MRYLMKSIGAFAVFALMAGGISQVSAHHSAAMFDFSKMMKLKGKVVEMRWVNPHVTITLNGFRQRGRSARRVADGNDKPRKSDARRRMAARHHQAGRRDRGHLPSRA